MLTSKPTKKMIEEWKQIYKENYKRLKPNRKTGTEVDRYFKNKYSPDKYDSLELREAVKDNIMMNEFNKEKLPQGVEPQIKTYKIENEEILIGIDLVTGYIHVESENTIKAAQIYDDLFVFRGLDEEDIKNFFLVAQYIQCSKE